MIAQAITGGLGIGMSIYDKIQAAKQQKEAKRALENLQRQKFTNIADGMQVSTLGSDLQKEEQARLASSQVSALQGAGTRGLIGGLGSVEAGNQNVNAKIAADLDMQQKQIDQIRAEDEARIRGMQEQRELADISALSSQYQAGADKSAMSTANAIQGLGMVANSGVFGDVGNAVGGLADKASYVVDKNKVVNQGLVGSSLTPVTNLVPSKVNNSIYEPKTPFNNTTYVNKIKPRGLVGGLGSLK